MFFYEYFFLLCLDEFLTSAGLENTPFGYDQGVGINEGKSERGWVVEKYRQKYDSIYDSLAHNDNKIVVSGTLFSYLILFFICS